MSKRKRRAKFGCLFLLLLILGGAGGFVWWVQDQTAALPAGEPFYLRFEEAETLNGALLKLKRKGVIKNIRAMRIYAIYKKAPSGVDIGTYQFRPGMTADETLAAMRKPVKQMVRIPETNLSFRTAN